MSRSVLRCCDWHINYCLTETERFIKKIIVCLIDNKNLMQNKTYLNFQLSYNRRY